MRNVVIAVLVGVASGLLGTLWERYAQGSIVEVASPVVQSVAPASSDDEPLSGDDEPPRSSQLGLVVHVSRDGEAVPAAAVRVLRREATRWVEQVGGSTDAKGVLPLPAAPGRYLVAATAAGGEALAQVDVAYGSRATAVTLRLAPPRQARGRVVDSKTHAPLPSALVSWLPGDEGGAASPLAHRTHADAFGRFSLDVPAGVEGELEAVDPQHQRASAAWTGREVELELDAAAFLSGVVVDGEGAPVAGATVRAAPAEEQALADAAGRFALKVSGGGTTVAALAPSGLQALQRVRLEPGERRGDLRLVVGRGAPLEGRVVDARGQGVAGAEVVVAAEPEQLELARVRTAASGAFTAYDLPQGRYTVAATAPQGARGQVVGVEDRAAPVEVKVVARARLEGAVLLASGHGAAGALVTVLWHHQLHEPPVTARADDEGHFVIDGLPSGQFEARATLSAVGEAMAHGYLEAGGTGSVEFRLAGLGELALELEPPRSVAVLIMGTELLANRREVNTDEHGAARVRLPAGRYTVIVPHHPGTHVVRDQVEVREGESTTFRESLDDPPDARPYRVLQSAAAGLSFDNGPGGVQVGFLMSTSPAAEAGLQSGDLVLAIGGTPVHDSLEAFAAVRGASELRLAIRRDGVDRELTVRSPE